MEIIKFDLQQLENEENGFAYYILGRSYDLEENGAEQSAEKALFYYKKGCGIGYPLCLYSLGISLEYGLGKVLEIDEQKAKQMLIDAYPKIIELIENPNTSKVERTYAKFVTGAYYYFGLGNINKDHKKAFEIIKSCAEEGHIAAIYDLGANFYYKGNGTEKNLELADYYLKLAKDNDLPRAIKLYEERHGAHK